MARKVKAIREIKLDKTDPGKKLEKDELCTVEELVENWIILVWWTSWTLSGASRRRRTFPARSPPTREGLL